VDVQRLKDNFARVAQHGDAVPMFFYSHLFVCYPEVRDLFPVSMRGQRDRLFGALGRIVSQVDDLDNLVPFLQQLGTDHRKFGTVAEHYPAVGASLIATLKHFSGPAWTAELEADWSGAYQLVAKVMTEAAEEAARSLPAWWQGTVIAHERRAFDVAVLRVRTEPPLGYTPGQSVAVETSRRPGLWRFYSPANTPRDNGVVDFHVRVVDGGRVSSALVRHVQVGETVRIGPPVGQLTLDPTSPRDLLMVAGSTGLAPLKAVIEQLAQQPQQGRRVALFFGARTPNGLYDLAELDALTHRCRWLTVVPAVSDDDLYTGERGLLPDVVARYGPWANHDVYVCGSPGMVEATTKQLLLMGTPEERIRFDEFGDA
jgi:NAD(P)H-flavin reductase/hemoglobin-like flavoprotein